MTITYRRSYYGTDDPTATPPPALIAKAEANLPYLHPQRLQTYIATAPHYQLRAQAVGPDCWTVTYTPEGS